MTSPSLTYSLSNGATADASQVMQNFNDIVNGITDGTKDLSISALTCAGTATLNGSVNLGNASSDDLTITASLAGTIPIKTTATYDIGSATLGLAGIYFGANSQTVRVVGSASMSATWTLTLPTSAGSAGNLFYNTGSGTASWTNLITTGKTIDGSADESQLIVEANATQTSPVLYVRKSDGSTNLFAVTNTGGSAIKATQLGDLAGSGAVGYILAGTRGDTGNCTTSQYFDMGSITLVAGDWDIYAVVTYTRSGATIISNIFDLGVSKNTGNSSSNLTACDTSVRTSDTVPASFTAHTMTIGPIPARCDGTNTILGGQSTAVFTTVYLKGFAGIFTGGPITWAATIYARIRR